MTAEPILDSGTTFCPGSIRAKKGDTLVKGFASPTALAKPAL